ncbi:MAG: glycine cleavage system protein GcvH [Lentisphaeria bacterium]|nr:glycine cleavage system protein GcvH [Lentisphaeria bacterium]
MVKYYSENHEWVSVDGDEAVIGISSYAAKELGDITYAEIPQAGTDFIVGDTVGTVESVGESKEVYSPVSGTVIEVNSLLEDDPGLVSRSPEAKGWICKLENIDLDELEELMEEADYIKYLKTL